ncbi:MAG: hypothetical protein H6835_14350 [Planctomycetes bacterium]|nr:hypothetical protein [Planctomycetota bacterium]
MATLAAAALLTLRIWPAPDTPGQAAEALPDIEQHKSTMPDADELLFLADSRDDLDEPPPWQPGPEVTKESFSEWRAQRLGNANPQQLDNPVWHWLVRTRIDAQTANEHFGGPDPFDAGPGFCFARFGQTCTRLDDGRLVRIGGEHEDSYDPDFCIYNDVVVRAADGALAIHGYPREVFPPTDFHSATQVGDRIVVIGCLGYPEQRRPGLTPVFAFDTATWACTAIEATGEAPGWIHRHTARLDANGGIVVTGGRIELADGPSIENIDDWRLDLAGPTWQRLTARRWTQIAFARRDGQYTSLSDLRLAATLQEEVGRTASAASESFLAEVRAELERRLGAPPEPARVADLYRFTVPHEPVPAPDGENWPPTWRIRIDGVTLRFEETSHIVRLVVEGELAPATIDTIVTELQQKLELLERCVYGVRRH